MKTIPFSKLEAKVNTKTETFKFGEFDIEVLQYLPAKDKYDLIENILQNSEENGLYNNFKLQVFTDVFVVLMYSNLRFDQGEMDDLFDLYDKLQSSGFLDEFYKHMGEFEFDEIVESIEEEVFSRVRYNLSVSSLVKGFLTNLPKDAQAAADIVDTFDPAQYQAVIDFANAANGGRHFKTNEPVPISFEGESIDD